MRRWAQGWALLGFVFVGSARADLITTLTPSADANIVGGIFQHVYAGNSPTLIEPIPGVHGPIQNDGLLSFDLSKVTGPVTSATLKLYEGPSLFSLSTPATFALYQNTSAWNPGTVTWATKPAVAAAAAAALTITDTKTGVWRTLDVTALVNSWLSGNAVNDGVTLAPTNTAAESYLFTSGHPLLWLPPKGDPNAPAPIGNFPDLKLFAPQLVLDTGAGASGEGPNSTPEPSGLVLAVLAMLALVGYGRRWYPFSLRR
jgi:hypothetical protein